MSESLLNDLEARCRLLTLHDDVVVVASDPFDPLDLDTLRHDLDDQEVLLPTDADEQTVAGVREHPAIGAVALKLAERGLALGVLPASYNPDPAKRAQLAFWPDQEDGEAVIRLGLPRGVEVGEAVVEAARVLAVVSNFPLPVDEKDSDAAIACEAVSTAFALQFAASFTLQQPVGERVKRFGQRLQDQVMRGTLDEAKTRDAAVWLWAYLTACRAEARPVIRSHVARFAPQVTVYARRLAARIGEAAPADADEARRLEAEIRRFLCEREGRCVGEKRRRDSTQHAASPNSERVEKR